MRSKLQFFAAVIGLFCLALSACTPNSAVEKTSSGLPAQGNAIENTPASGQVVPTQSGGTEPTLAAIGSVPDPLDNLIQLRSISITLTGLQPDGSKQSILVEIDAEGSMHVIYSMPPVTGGELPEGADLTGLPANYEVYVIGGSAYAPSDSDPSWTANPFAVDYSSTLSDQVHELDGFTTWLDLLPKGSLKDSGIESIGGFSTNKYSVDGRINGQQVTGMLWYDSQTHSLVQAELHVPAVLDSNPDKPENGEIVITLSARQVEIAPIVLPAK